jgi:hypothetical protein
MLSMSGADNDIEAELRRFRPTGVRPELRRAVSHSLAAQTTFASRSGVRITALACGFVLVAVLMTVLLTRSDDRPPTSSSQTDGVSNDLIRISRETSAARLVAALKYLDEMPETRNEAIDARNYLASAYPGTAAVQNTTYPSR